MIETLRDKENRVVSYIEWEVVDEEGQYKNGGEYIYIQNFWTHDLFRYKGFTGKIITKIYHHPLSQKSNYVYWQVTRDMNGNKIIDEETRSHKSKRMSKTYDKEYIYKKLKGEK